MPNNTANSVKRWLCHRFAFTLDQPLVMGIVNLTDQSFSGDGVYGDDRNWVHSAIKHAEKQAKEGANILDVGAESSRPGSQSIPEEIESKRLSLVLPELLKWNIPISVDTVKPQVMKKTLDMGVDIINDINGFSGKYAAGEAWEVMSTFTSGAVIMHKQGTPATMQDTPKYDDVLAEIEGFLREQSDKAIKHGIDQQRLAFDPGFGFGKTLLQNTTLFHALPKLSKDFMPLLVGVSRKSMLGEITGLPVEERLTPSIVAAVLAIQSGVKVLRVHDVKDTIAGIRVVKALKPTTHNQEKT